MSFAPDWLMDARAEAMKNGPSSRRREIVFAVCFVESYLYEWLRNNFLSRATGFLRYLPKRREGIAERWKSVLKELQREELIERIPDFQNADWQRFTELVTYRDGLVHALASVPEGDTDTTPVPLPGALNAWKPGEAVSRAVQIVRDLHRTVGMSGPEWLETLGTDSGSDL